MWSIDRIEGDFALCENTVTGETCRIPLSELPQEIGEGALLHRTPAGWQRAKKRNASVAVNWPPRSAICLAPPPLKNKILRKDQLHEYHRLSRLLPR